MIGIRATPSTLLPALAFALALVPSTVQSEPVEVRHDGDFGAGYSFRRGATCRVLTAEHVVSDVRGALVVTDRSSAKAPADVTYANPAYDVALLTLPDETPVACTTRWPDAGALSKVRLSARTMFEVVRHYPDGGETLVVLRYAGSTPNTLLLQHVDDLRIIASDSGAMVSLDGEPVGIVSKVHPEDGSVEVVKMEVIDQLVGAQFQDAGAAAGMIFSGVFQNNRPHALYTTYVQAWLMQNAGRTLLPEGDPDARCTMQVDLLSWQRGSQPNPQYANAEKQQKAYCGKNGFVWEQLCKGAKNTLASAPRSVMVHKLMLNVTMAPPSGPAQTRLDTVSLAPPPTLPASGPELEMAVLQSAVHNIATPMFEAGGCT